MDPDFERRLRNEVIYLHSLWHQGPPRPHPTNLHSDALHRLANPPQFKTGRINPRWKRGRKSKNQYKDEGKNPTQLNEVSGKEWPCSSTSGGSPATTIGWAAVTDKPNSQRLSLSPEQKARNAANRAQLKALNATKEFFRSKNNDDDGDIEDDDDYGGNETQSDDDLMEEGDEVEEYRFFLKMFMEDSGLREYYEKNYESGEFSCLVCGGVGKKNAGKRFKDCMALVQHSISIARKRHAHRAYGQAICKVLSWEVDRLPTIVLSLNGKLGASLNSSGVGEAEAQGGVGDVTKEGPNSLGNIEAPVDTRNGEELPEKESAGNENLPNNDESLVFENSLAAAKASKCAEDFNLTVPEMVADKESEQTNQVNSLTITEASKCAGEICLIVPEMEEDKESGQVNHVEPAKEPAIGHEGQSRVTDDQVKGDGAI